MSNATVVASAPQTVSGLAIAGMMFTFILCIFVPLAMARLFRKDKDKIFLTVIFGALGFVVPQVLIRMPLMQTPQYAQLATKLYTVSPLLYCLFLGFSAAIFETTGRLIVAKFLLKKPLTYNRAGLAGTAHGGIEAVLLVGLTMANNLMLSIQINGNGFDAVLNALPEASRAAAGPMMQQLVSTPGYMFFLGGIERLFTVLFHIAMTMLLCEFIIKRKTLVGFLFVVMCHTTLDFLSAYGSVYGINVLIIESYIGVAATLSVVYMRTARNTFPKLLGKPPVPTKAVGQK